MNHLSSIQKLFIISALCIAVFINPSSASADDFEKSPALSDGAKKSIPLHVGQKPITRAKRFLIRTDKLRWGTNWCLDQIDDPKSDVAEGLFFQTDLCCKKLVNCTYEQKDILQMNYPDRKFNKSFRSCACDEEFAYCLSKVAFIKFKAHLIGNYYFNYMAPFCQDDKLELQLHPSFPPKSK